MNSREFREATREANRLDKSLRKMHRTASRGMGGRLRGAAKTAGAIGAAGIFGGAEGFAGAAIGGLFGGVPGAVVGGTRSAKGLFRTIKKKLVSGDGKVKTLGLKELLDIIFGGNKNPIKKKIVNPKNFKVNPKGRTRNPKDGGCYAKRRKTKNNTNKGFPI